MGTCRTPPHEICREYARKHFAQRQSARTTQLVLANLPWDDGHFELLGPKNVDLVPVSNPEELGWSQNKAPLPHSWLYPVDVLCSRLRELVGRSGHWLVFDSGVCVRTDVTEFELERFAATVSVGTDVVLGADAGVSDDELLKLIQLASAAWGLVVLIGRGSLPTAIDERVIRGHADILVIIAHDGDAFLLWRRAS